MERIFSEELNAPVVQETLRWYLASRRRGTHCAKTRGEVAGGGKKPWRQKGTGRARVGSIRSPLWRKGGVIFPPRPRSYAYNLPRRMRKLALRVILSEFHREGRVKVFEKFSLPRPKTKEGAQFLKAEGAVGKVLIILGGEAPDFQRGIRNLEGVKVILSKDLNVYDLLQADGLWMDREALAQLEKRTS